MTIHEQEEELFHEWEKYLHTNDKIGYDGLLYRGRIYYSVDGFWGREEGDEEQMWRQAQHRILFLTKDLNDDTAWDIREETGRKNHSGEENVVVSERFYKNYMRYLYGLFHTSAAEYPSFLEVDQQSVYQPFFDEAPVARMNLKKVIGGGSLSNSVLKGYLKDPVCKELTLRQMKLYDADIIFCCGGSSSIKNFVVANYLPDAVEINDWVYYSPGSHKVIVDSYHFTHRKTDAVEYEHLMEAWQDFLRKGLEF